MGDPKLDRFEDGEKLTSVTTFVHHYVESFDADSAAARVAVRDGKTVDAVKAAWKAAADYSCYLGTKVHANQEDMMNGKRPQGVPNNDNEKKIMAAGYSAMCALWAEGWRPMAAERVIFSPIYKLAGTVDAIFQHETSKEILIVDWKTNKQIRATSPYNAYCKPPIIGLPSCELTSYSLQLSIYQKILVHERYLSALAKIQRRIVHLRPGDFNVIPVDYREGDVNRLLLDYLVESQWYAEVPPF